MALENTAGALISLHVPLASTVHAYLSVHNTLCLEDFGEHLSIKSSLFHCTTSHSTFPEQNSREASLSEWNHFAFRFERIREVKKVFRISRQKLCKYFFFPSPLNQNLSCQQTKCILTARAGRMCLQEQNSITHLQFMNSLIWQLSNRGLNHCPQTKGWRLF